MKLKKSTRNTLIIVAVSLLMIVTLGALTQGFTNFKWESIKETAIEKVVKERNPDNLIETVALETGKDPTSDVTFTVDKYGRVKLSGTASADSTVTYATVTLPAGTYYLTGDDEGSSAKTEFLAIYDGSNNLIKRADMGAFVVASEATYTIKIAVKEDAIFNYGVQICPVLSADEDTPFFAEH